MKTTRISCRVFNHNGSVLVKRKQYMSIQEAIEYVEKEMSSTGEVEFIEYMDGETVVKKIKNNDFRPPFVLETHRASAFLKHQQSPR